MVVISGALMVNTRDATEGAALAAPGADETVLPLSTAMVTFADPFGAE